MGGVYAFESRVGTMNRWGRIQVRIQIKIRVKIKIKIKIKIRNRRPGVVHGEDGREGAHLRLADG